MTPSRARRTNPAVQEKMRQMMRDPEAIAELGELMKDPAFKAQVEAFSMNPEVAKQMANGGASAFLGGAAAKPTEVTAGSAREAAAARAESNMEYDKYSAQFSGEEKAAQGLQNLQQAARDPTMLRDAIADLNDPEMMASARDMMADPDFQAEMKRMMEQPEMRKIVEASRSMVEEMGKDPAKMAEMQEKIAQMMGGGAGGFGGAEL